MSESVKIDKLDHVAVVTLNRPQKHNAIDLDMFTALASAGTQLGNDPSVRAIVVEGAGPSFCAGIDLSIFEQGDIAMLMSKMAPAEDSPANLFQRAAFVWREVPQPVICALHGSVFGGGLQIALGADLRFGSADSRYSVMEIKWGLIPDMAITTTLARLIPVDKAKELAWTGRVFDAVEARDMGVITALHDNPSHAARQAAASIAGRSPKAIQATKRLFDESAEMSVQQALRLEAQLQLSLLGGDQQIEAVAANREKRAPNFRD